MSLTKQVIQRARATSGTLGFAAGIASLALVLAGGAYAAGQEANPPAGQGPGRGGPGGRGPRGGPGGPGLLAPMMLERLNLSDGQKTGVREILDSHREEQKALGDRAMAARSALEAAINGDSFDEAAVRTRAAEASAVEAEMAVARARVHAEVVQLLTSEQLAELKKTQAEMRSRMERMRGNREQRRERL